MTYREWVHWLETRNPMPLIRPGIEKTAAAMNEAGLLDLVDPQKVIHIAGTNGKGTTAKTLERLFLASGQSVGLYTSPHLVETTERIRSHGKDISQNMFSSLCEQYRPLIEKYDLSHFEALTLFAVDYFFKQKKTDWMIFEIGLGGTWDATNVIPHGTSVITSLGFDHMNILGNSLEDIAHNKFGIIQKNNTVIHGVFDQNIQDILKEKLRSERAQEIIVAEPLFTIENAKPLPRYILNTPWGDARLSLPGARAARNMNLALYVFKALGFDPRSVLSSLAEIEWPGRMTQLKVSAPCPVYISGDHNVQGIESLIEILNNTDYDRLHLILGVSKNRSLTDFLMPLSALPDLEITLTKPEFQGVTPDIPGAIFFEKPADALKHVIEKAQPKDLIVISGSLYLCGDFLKNL